MKAALLAAFDKARAAWNSDSELRRIVRDVLEGGLAAVASLTITVPANLPEAKAQAIVVGTAFAAAAIAVFRREGIPYLAAKLGLS